MILDGYGMRDTCEHNAVCEAKTPIMDQLMSQCPFVRGNASGLAVGLPDGQMGNSEVGHLNMGAGRIVSLKIRNFWQPQTPARKMIPPCICSDWYQTAVFTAI